MPVPMSTIVATTFQNLTRHASSAGVQAAAAAAAAAAFVDVPPSPHSSSTPSCSLFLCGRGGRKYTPASERQRVHVSACTNDFLWHTERVRSPLTLFVSFTFVTSAAPSSTIRAPSMQSAHTGPCAAHVGSYTPSLVRSVLISNDSHFPALGVGGDEFNDCTGATVSAAVTVLESHVCV